MAQIDNPIAVDSRPGPEVDQAPLESSENWFGQLSQRSEVGHILITIGTTFAVFAIYLIQGIVLARLLGPTGRGEFGTALFFPRDILLYVGLLGGIEIINRHASQGDCDTSLLKRAAARLGMTSGLLTGITAAIVATVALLLIDGGAKAYLIPYCLLICLFVPWEHIHLTVSAVDRGHENYWRYNVNRLLFAASFPLLVLLMIGFSVHLVAGKWLLASVCVLFVVARIVGLLPTLRGIRLGDWYSNPIQSPDAAPVPSTGSLLKQGRPYAMSMLATEVFERLDILLILALGTVQEAGFYFVAIPAATLLTIAPNALGVFTFNAGADNRSISLGTVYRFLTGLVLFQVVAAVCLATVIPWLIAKLYGTDFQPSIMFVWFLLPACAIKGLLQAVDGYLKGCGKPLIGVWARGLSIFVMLLFVAFAYQRFELLSIPMAACAGQAVSMAIITVAAIREASARSNGDWGLQQ